MFHELVGLALRRVVRDFHAGIPCFGTFRRPQVRSNSKPLGFDTSDPFTAYHDRLAQRTAFILTIALLAGAFISVEQPRNSRLYRLHCSKVLLQLGCVISHVAFCCYGSAFHKPSKWLHNKPWLCELESKGSYNQSKGHFKIEGSFTKSSVEVFRSMCKPSCEAVYGVCPKPGDAVAAFSAAYPRALVSRMASGLLAAKSGQLHPESSLSDCAIFAKLACWILIQFRCHHRKNRIHLVSGSKILNGLMRFVIALASKSFSVSVFALLGT